MLNIIKSDIYRLFRSVGFYIAVALIIIISVMSIITMQGGRIGISASIGVEETENSDNLPGSTGENAMTYEKLDKLNRAKSVSEFRSIMKSFGSYELDKEIIGQNANLYYVIIFIVGIIITKDFSYKSVKNTLSSAVSRKKYFFSKFLLVLGISTILILFNNYFTYFLNIIVNGKEFASTFADITKVTLLQLPLLYGIICLLICFAFLTKKTSLFNTISIPFLMICELIIIMITSMFKIKANFLVTYELQSVMNSLVSNPTNEFIWKCSLLGIAYMIVFTIIGYYSFKNAEIK